MLKTNLRSAKVEPSQGLDYAYAGFGMNSNENADTSETPEIIETNHEKAMAFVMKNFQWV